MLHRNAPNNGNSFISFGENDFISAEEKKTVKCMLHCSDFATRDHRNAEIVAIFFFIIKT